MTNSELKEALFSRQPVMHMGVRYDYVSAIIYRVAEGKLVITAELTDSISRSTSVVPAGKVQLATEQEGDDG